MNRPGSAEAHRAQLEALGVRGFVAERMFPGQKRAALARIYVVRSSGVQAAEVAKVLEPFGTEVEYVEGPVARKAVGRCQYAGGLHGLEATGR